MADLTTHTLDVTGGVLTYDVRRSDASREPVLFLVGSPMGADGFAALAEQFPDRTTVTCDPLGVGRSPRADGGSGSTPDEHAACLHQLISALGAGPVDLFGSSGGAVNGLALAARHSEQLRTLVAHEPPTAQTLPDCQQVLAASADIHATYERRGFGPAMAKFLALVSQRGRCRPATLPVLAPILPPSGSPPRTTAPGMTLSLAPTCSGSRSTRSISTPCVRDRRASCSGWVRNRER